MKLFDFGILVIVAMFFAWGVYTLEKASDGNKRPVTKKNLIEAVSPITPSKTYND